MVGTPGLQEQFPARASMAGKLPSEGASSHLGILPGEMQEQFPAWGKMAGKLLGEGAYEALRLLPGGLQEHSFPSPIGRRWRAAPDEGPGLQAAFKEFLS